MSIDELVKRASGIILYTSSGEESDLLEDLADKLEELAAENEQMRTVRRWSLDEADGTLYVCRGEHEKSEPCGWEPFIPLSQSEAALAEKDEEIAALQGAWLALGYSKGEIEYWVNRFKERNAGGTDGG